MFFTIALSIFASVVVNVHCQKNVVDLSKRVGFVYLIPLTEPIYLNAVNNENEIDSDDRKILPLPRLILALAPAVEDEKDLVSEESIKTDEKEVALPISPEARSKRSPGGGGCSRCGYRPSGGGGKGGGGGGGAGGGGGGSWSQSSASSSSGGWGGGGGKSHG